MEKVIEALQSLMPLGGWSYNEKDGVTVHEDGLAFGYTKPSQEELNAAVAALENIQYQKDRASEYPTIGDQLDALWKELNPQNAEAQAMKAKIQAVKDKYPKP